MTLFFWGSLVVAVVTAALALRKRAWWWMCVSLVMYLPFVLYVSATPRFGGFWVVASFQIVAIVALNKSQLRLAQLAMGGPTVMTLYVLVLLMM